MKRLSFSICGFFMKKIVYYINLFLIVSFLFLLSACKQPGNSGSFKEIDSEEKTSSDFDPFAGTTWCGTLYEDEFTSPGKNGYGELLKFGTEKNNLIGKELGTVEFPNEIYFFWPENYEANEKAGYENSQHVLKKQKWNYYVEKTKDGYAAIIGILGGEWLRLTIKSEGATEGTLRMTSHGYMSYGYENNKVTWYDDDLLPRILSKKE